jgi:hypothetical protein
MRHETAIAAALKRAGGKSAEAELYSLAAQLLHKAGGEPDTAPQLALAKFCKALGEDESLLRECALAYLRRVVSDMKRLPELDGRGHRPVDAHEADAAPSGRNGRGHTAVATQVESASPAREPSPQQKAADRAAQAIISKAVLDTFVVRDGRAIRKVRIAELPDLRTANLKEAFVVQQLWRRYGNAADMNATVGEVVKETDMVAIIRKAEEMTDAI